jgi:hypothetical protein
MKPLLNALANTGIAWRIYPVKSPGQVVPRGTRGGPPSDRIAGPSDPSRISDSSQSTRLTRRRATFVFHVEHDARFFFACLRTFHVERPVLPRGGGVAVPVDPRNFRQRSIDVACAADGRHSCSTWNTRHEIPRTCPRTFHVEPLPRSADEIAGFAGMFHVERPVCGI